MNQGVIVFALFAGELKVSGTFSGEIDITCVQRRVYRRALHERHKDAGGTPATRKGKGSPTRNSALGAPGCPRHEHGHDARTADNALRRHYEPAPPASAVKP